MMKIDTFTVAAIAGGLYPELVSPPVVRRLTEVSGTGVDLIGSPQPGRQHVTQQPSAIVHV